MSRMPQDPTPPPKRDDLAAKLLVTAELFEVGVALQRERLQRENPTLRSEEIEALVEAWLASKRVDEHRDGVLGKWPRS